MITTYCHYWIKMWNIWETTETCHWGSLYGWQRHFLMAHLITLISNCAASGNHVGCMVLNFRLSCKGNFKSIQAHPRLWAPVHIPSSCHGTFSTRASASSLVQQSWYANDILHFPNEIITFHPFYVILSLQFQACQAIDPMTHLFSEKGAKCGGTIWSMNLHITMD